jgi:hypothetical protein
VAPRPVRPSVAVPVAVPVAVRRVQGRASDDPVGEGVRLLGMLLGEVQA